MDGKSGNLVTGMRAAWKVVFIAAIAFAAALPVRAHAADGLPPFPPAGKRLTDLAKAINAPEQTKLIGKLKEIEEKTGAQVAVLVVETTQPLAMEEYAIRVFDVWKLGQANINNGLLVLVATADKKVRIEVGRGLEGVIPDAQAKRIIDEAMVPPFRQGKYAAGINAGLDRIQALIVAGQKPAAVLPPGVDQFAREPSFEMGSGLISLLVFIAIVVALVKLSRLFGWDKNPTRPIIIDQDEDSSSSTSNSGSTGGSGSSSGGSRDSNAMNGGGGNSAGGGASSSFGDASSSGGDSGSSDSGSSGSSGSDSSDSNRS